MIQVVFIIIFILLQSIFQDLPSYAIMLSLLALSIDRYQILVKPNRKRLSMNVVLPLVWVLSLSMVLPYMAYISHFYLDVSLYIHETKVYCSFKDLGPGFEGGEFCVVSLDGDVALYMRVLFFLL